MTAVEMEKLIQRHVKQIRYLECAVRDLTTSALKMQDKIDQLERQAEQAAEKGTA